VKTATTRTADDELPTRNTGTYGGF
jgi:hypothetical protein